VNFLTKIGARYEYDRDELCVWYGGEEFEPTKIESSPTPGFLADWLPFATLILNQAQGTSFVHNTIYVDRLGFVQDLNRMGADIELKKPSETGFQAMISDESYDYNKYGEPSTVAEINGPRKLRGVRLNMEDPRFDTALIIAALSAEGRSELLGIDEMFIRHERFFEKLSSLGAELKRVE
jgi:UDP-N-acetylglucosamine 1-carboxyvinyltransferase